MTSFFSLQNLGLAASSSQLLSFWLQEMQSAYPGYEPSNANLEFVQAQIFSALAADVANLCGNGATELFRTYGTTLANVPYLQGVSAQALLTISAQAAPSTIATTSADLTVARGAIVSIPVIALQFGIAAGTITLTSGVNTQMWTTSGANAGDTAIPVSTQTPNFDYPGGSTIGGVQAYSLPALSQFVLDSLGFQNLAPYTINSGDSALVAVTAVTAGSVFNGAGSGASIQSVQQLLWVDSITVYAVASGGQEPEDDAHYLDRLATQLQLQAPRPITASDYGVMALNFDPYPGTDQQEVGRATAVDGYNPADASFGNARMIALAVTDNNGFALNSDTLYGYPNGSSANVITTRPNPTAGWGIAGWLESMRETNFLVNLVQPTYALVYITVTVKAQLGWDATSVAANVESSLLAYLAPVAWGLPLSSESGWQNATTVYQSKVMGVVQQSSGVDHIVDGSLLLGLTPSPSSQLDLALPGPIALPTSTAASIVVNVT